MSEIFLKFYNFFSRLLSRLLSRPRLKKIFIWVICFFIFFTLAGFFALPPVLKSILTKKLSENLHREVTIRQIKLNPYSLSIAVRGLAIKDKDSPELFVSCEEFFVNLQSLSALKRALILSEIRLKQPFIRIVQHPDKTFNFSDLIEKKESVPQEKKPSKPLNFSLNNIKIENGSMDFLDETKQKKHTIRELNIGIPFLSNIPYYIETYVQPSFSAQINGTPYTLQGRTKPFTDSRETTLDINIKDLDIPYYLAYVPMKMNFRVVSASLDTRVQITFVETKDKKPSLSVNGNIALKNVVVNDSQDKPLFKLPLLNISIAPSKPLIKIIHLSKISIGSPELEIRRDHKGAINLQALLPGKGGTKPAPQTTGESTPLSLDIDEVQLTDGKISFIDSLPSQPVTLSAKNLELRGENISMAKDSRAKLSLSLLLGKKGTISTTGTMSINPMTADFAMDLKGIEVGLFQSFFSDKVNLVVTSGSFSTTGTLLMESSENKPLKTVYKGNVTLSNFSTIDKANKEDFLKWKSLSLNDLSFVTVPFSVDIKKISLTDFYSRVMRNASGSLNLQDAFKQEESGEVKTSPPPTAENKGIPQKDKVKEPEKNIKIGAITLQGGRIDFSDKSVNPEFSIHLSEIGGRISALSSKENTTADVDLRGKINDYTPLEITGKINPLREDLFVDLKLAMRDLDLSPATPYSGKYVGYTIEKGKFSFDLKYHIEKRKLDSQNSIFFDQFTFGNRVESPQATKLPVKLALALLKDRKGEIKLDLPVSGSLDNPEFSIWGVLLKVLVNLISKAATSPFSLIGSAFGGGEELSYIEFDYGSTAISDQNLKKIDTVTKVLYDRPSLKMDIVGHVDPENDKEGLKQTLFQRKLKSQKLEDILKKGEPAVAVDEAKIGPEEYEKYLKKAYKQEKFQKPKNVLGMAKDLPGPEMEKLMLANIEIKEGDLRTLASERAMKVKEGILKSGQVEPERIFILEPKSLPAEKKEKIRDSRVDFILK